MLTFDFSNSECYKKAQMLLCSVMRRNELPETNKRVTVQRGGEEGKLKCENVFQTEEEEEALC